MADLIAIGQLAHGVETPLMSNDASMRTVDHPRAHGRVRASGRLGLWDTTAMAVGGMIGGGIFTVLGVAITVAGHLAAACFLIGLGLAALTARSYTGMTRGPADRVDRSSICARTVIPRSRDCCCGCWSSVMWS